MARRSSILVRLVLLAWALAGSGGGSASRFCRWSADEVGHHHLICECPTGIERAEDTVGVEERVPTELTLIGCSFAAAGGLRLSPRTSSLRLQNFTVLDLSLASTDWSGVERLELRHVRQLLGLDADTFRPMAALRELLVENAELSGADGAMLTSLARRLRLVSLKDVQVQWLATDDALRVSADRVVVSRSQWGQVALSVDAGDVDVDGNEFLMVAAAALRLRARRGVAVRANRFELIRAAGLVVNATSVDISHNRFDALEAGALASVSVSGDEHDVVLRLSDNTWATSFPADGPLDVGVDFEALRRYGVAALHRAVVVAGNALPCRCDFPNNVVDGHVFVDPVRAIFFKQFSAKGKDSRCVASKSGETLRQFLTTHCAAAGATDATDATDAGRPVLVAGPSPPSHGGHQVISFEDYDYDDDENLVDAGGDAATPSATPPASPPTPTPPPPPPPEVSAPRSSATSTPAGPLVVGVLLLGRFVGVWF